VVATVQTKKNICVTVTLVILITYMELKMSNFDRVLSHLGHELEVAVYGDNENVAIECLTCMEVVVDYDQGDHDD